MTVWPAIASVAFVSLASLIGAAGLALNPKTLKAILPFLVSFAAGALLGDVFIHLLPETASDGFPLAASFGIIAGIFVSFALEKIIHWHHCHHSDHKHEKPLGAMNLIGDGLHNFLDGIVIGASFLVSNEVGIATTVAVLLHELPQELGDFAILVHAGYSRTQALLWNVVSACTAFLGLAVAFLVGEAAGFADALVPFAAGTFLYIALADIIPELHQESRVRYSLLQLFAIGLGVAVMASLLLLEHA